MENLGPSRVCCWALNDRGHQRPMSFESSVVTASAFTAGAGSSGPLIRASRPFRYGMPTAAATTSLGGRARRWMPRFTRFWREQRERRLGEVSWTGQSAGSEGGFVQSAGERASTAIPSSGGVAPALSGPFVELPADCRSCRCRMRRGRIPAIAQKT